MRGGGGKQNIKKKNKIEISPTVQFQTEMNKKKEQTNKTRANERLQVRPPNSRRIIATIMFYKIVIMMILYMYEHTHTQIYDYIIQIM